VANSVFFSSLSKANSTEYDPSGLLSHWLSTSTYSQNSIVLPKNHSIVLSRFFFNGLVYFGGRRGSLRYIGLNPAASGIVNWAIGVPFCECFN
jgi:hypothetical protein